MGYSERARQTEANIRYEEYRESLTPKDIWEGREDDYIDHLIKKPTYEWVDGKVETIRGFKAVDIHFYDYLENQDLAVYHQAKQSGWAEWMLGVKNRYLELRAQGKLEDIDVDKAEREEREYWTRYYDEHPQFSRPEGY
jgi:hypothetical protein